MNITLTRLRKVVVEIEWPVKAIACASDDPLGTVDFETLSLLRSFIRFFVFADCSASPVVGQNSRRVKEQRKTLAGYL